MSNAKKTALDLAVTHLNAPVGPILSKTDLSNALKAGSLSVVDKRDAAALIAYLFVELDPQLIIRCVNELHSGLLQANALYSETLRSNSPRSRAWERAVDHFL